jgi:hypothetical protein
MDPHLPGDIGAAEPGLDRLLRTLASAPAGDELAGEQAALAMFRENSRPAARPARPAGVRLRHRLGVAAVATIALVGGFTAAAYFAVLPAPIQHIAYSAFGAIGVPDAHHGKHGAGPATETGHQRKSGPGRGHPSPSAGASTPSGKPSRSGSPPSPGQPQLTAAAVSAQINAGTGATIDGRLTGKSGRAMSGVTISLMERTASHQGWQLAGQATTSQQGNVAVTVSSLTTDAQFRLTDSSGAASQVVTVTVVPTVTITITQGPRGYRDFVSVSSQYAEPGDVVVLQVDRDGNWVGLRRRTLNASGQTEFVVKSARMGGKSLRVKLVATLYHAVAFSNPETAPAPD